MPIYNYKARDANGKKVSGTMEALNNKDVIDKLRKMGCMATSVSEAMPGIEVSFAFERFRWINSNSLLMFYIQLSNLINAGISVLVSLSTLSKQTENKALKESINSIAKQVESGSTLSGAFATCPHIFTKVFISMVKAGETSGKLDVVLMRYAKFFEQQEDLRQKIKGALFYPMILLCVGLAVTIFIVTFIIPQFADIYLKAGVKLPIPTLIVYKAGTAIKNYWYFFIIIAVIILVGLRYFLRTKKGLILFDTLKLRLPVISPLYRKIAISRFVRTLSTLLGSGVSILESLNITREVVNNEILSQTILNVQKSVEKGERMANTLQVSEEFPPDVVQMISVGEESGGLVEMLNKTADYYDMTVDYAIKKLTTVIEPIFLVFLGGMVGMIMAAMLLPIFDMVKTLRR